MPANALRGIGQWSTEYVLHLARDYPDLIACVSVDPVLPLPQLVNYLPAHIPVIPSSHQPERKPGEIWVFHALSIFEDLALDRLWPFWARQSSVALVVTLYDMIPALFPDDYFTGTLRGMLQSRYELTRHANAVISISHATATAAVELLQLDRERVSVCYGAFSSSFQPNPHGAATALASLAAALDIEGEFLLVVGNIDPRKNLLGLMRSYAMLPRNLREQHPLVITCSQAAEDDLQLLTASAASLGISSTTRLIGFVDQRTLVHLYQACWAMVYPSHNEGLGMPVIEALLCGAAVIASDIAPIRELIRDSHALFDPNDTVAMTDALRRILTDCRFRTQRRAAAGSDSQRLNWRSVAPGALRAYALAATDVR